MITLRPIENQIIEFILDLMESKMVDEIPLKEKPMHIPRVPPIDPTIPITSKTKRSW